MRARWLGLLLALLCCQAALAQSPLPGFPLGVFDNKAALSASSGGGGYTGIGDLGLSSPVAYWGLRCYSTSYSGNVADVWDGATGSTTETLITCSSGGTLNQTIHTLATTCAVSCVVKTLYDQSGANSCSSAACDLTQTTNALRPTFSTACSVLTGANPWCMVFNGTSQYLSISSGPTQAQPFTFSAVARRNGGTTTIGQVLSNAGTNNIPYIGFYSTSGQVIYSASANRLGTFTEGNWAPFEAAFNSAGSSELYIEGSLSTVSPGSVTMTGAMGIGSGHLGSDYCNCNITEAGIWGASLISSFTAMTSNQRTYWGF